MNKKDEAKQSKELVEKQARYKWRTGSEVITVCDAATWYLSVCQSQRKSDNTIAAYRNNINRIGNYLAALAETPVEELPLTILNKNDLADAFSEYSATHAPSSQQQCWAVWNNMCQLLVDHEVLDRNPMNYVVSSGSRRGKTIPRALPKTAVETLLASVARPASQRTGRISHRRWLEQEYAIILLLLATGIRESELCNLNMGDLASPFDDSRARTVLVKGKGGKERTLVIEAPVVDVIEDYLHSRWKRLPATGRPSKNVWECWKATDPLFVKLDGERIKRDSVYQKVKLAYQEAGITGYQSKGALVHQLRHTFATMLADDPNVTTFQLKNLLGHESLNTTERYTSGAGRATRDAVRRNPVYGMIDAG